MIIPSGAVRVLVATRPVDFRKGADGLCALVQETLHSRSLQWRDLRVSFETRRPREAFAVGWQRAGARIKTT